MKCKLVEINTYQIMGKTLDVPTGNESEIFEFSELVAEILGHENFDSLCEKELLDELRRQVSDINTFDVESINNHFGHESSWNVTSNYSRWKLVEIDAPTVKDIASDVVNRGGLDMLIENIRWRYAKRRSR